MRLASRYWPFVALVIISLLLSLWSYTLVDPNLFLLSQPWWVELQSWFWQNRGDWAVLAAGYGILVLAWWAVYLAAPRLVQFRAWPERKIPVVFLAFGAMVIAVLWIGHNALSHDIFNYLFNARMVVEYGANPHVCTALEFAYDPWVRFMHNVHTSAPYGYGWTALSLIPYIAGMGTFLLAYLAMKGWMVLGLLLYIFFGWRLFREAQPQADNRVELLWLFVANPLLLWETVLNGHNDVWMMWPALAAMWLLFRSQKTKQWWMIVGTAVLLGLSISVKLVTVVLIPFVVGLLLWPWLKQHLSGNWRPVRALGEHLSRYWAEYAVLVLLAPLVTQRSQQFLPWYLIWSWSFFPLVRWSWLRWFLLALAFTSQLRYIPWLLNALEYTDALQVQMRLVTWSALGVAVVLLIKQGWKWLPKSK